MINEALTHWLLLRENIHKTKSEHFTTFLVEVPYHNSLTPCSLIAPTLLLLECELGYQKLRDILKDILENLNFWVLKLQEP
jgi:hypothetical protein